MLSDIGVEATVSLDAWPVSRDPRQPPLYSLAVSGTEGHPVDNALFLISRGLEETDWWSVYQLGNGRHLFDTHVPLLTFSISRETLTNRYVGLEIPPDDTADAHLKKPNVIGVLSYASEDRVLGRVLITCDDPKQAQLMRSYADTTRAIAWSGGDLRLSFSDNYPSPGRVLTLLIPVRHDGLDLQHAQLPLRIHTAFEAPAR